MTIQEIEARLAEIRKLIESASAEEIESLSAEVDGLVAEREALKAAEEKRAAIRSMVASSSTSAAPVIPEARKEYSADSEEYRRAWLKSMAVFRSQDGTELKLLGDMTAEEREAFTFTTANTTSVVPTVVQNRIIELVRSMAPLYDDATKSGMTQGFSVPRHTAITQGDAATTSEGVANDDEIDTFSALTLTGVEIKKHVKITRKMQWQSITAFEDWLVQHISKRIAVAKDSYIITQLNDTTPGIASGNKISRTYTDNAIREALGLLTESGQVVWYASAKTIYNGLAGIKDNNGRPLFLESTVTDDPKVKGRIYGGIVKEDANIPDNVVYVGVPRSILANDFEALFIGRSTDMTTFVTTIGGYSLFDAGLENPTAFVKITFTSAPVIAIPSTASVAVDATYQIPVIALSPADATITWSSGTIAKGTVDSTGTVTGKASGSTVITASITVGGTTVSDTCTVTVTS